MKRQEREADHSPSYSAHVKNGGAVPPFLNMSLWQFTLYKVAGSIPDEVIGIFISATPSNRTVAVGSTQPLTEMSARNHLGG
jgi:hypothetical protein